MNEQVPVDVFLACRAVALEGVPDGSSPMLGKPVVLHAGLFPDFGIDRRERHCAPSFHGWYDQFGGEAHVGHRADFNECTVHAVLILLPPVLNGRHKGQHPWPGTD